jgi:hypothetical protein
MIVAVNNYALKTVIFIHDIANAIDSIFLAVAVAEIFIQHFSTVIKRIIILQMLSKFEGFFFKFIWYISSINRNLILPEHVEQILGNSSTGSKVAAIGVEFF